MEQSLVLQHHPLNTSDHHPVKIDGKWSTEGNDASPPPRKINWTKAIEEDLIKICKEGGGHHSLTYRHTLSIYESPWSWNLYSSFENNSSLVLSPHTGWKSKMKLYIKVEALQSIYKEQRKAGKRWSDAGKPRIGPLYEQQKGLKKQVSQYLRDLQAAEERQEIQKRDQMFRSRDHNCFRKPATRAPCGDRLIVRGSLVTKRRFWLSGRGTVESWALSNLKSYPRLLKLQRNFLSWNFQDEQWSGAGWNRYGDWGCHQENQVRKEGRQR